MYSLWLLRPNKPNKKVVRGIRMVVDVVFSLWVILATNKGTDILSPY